MSAVTATPVPISGHASQTPVYVIHDATETDMPFVARSWAETYRGYASYMRSIESQTFSGFVYPLISEILKRAQVRVASPPGDEATIYGFSVMEPGVIHMVYTRKAWRKMGIAKALLGQTNLSEHFWSTPSQDLGQWIRHKWPMRGFLPFWMGAKRNA